MFLNNKTHIFKCMYQIPSNPLLKFKFWLGNWVGLVKVKTNKTKSFSFSIFIFGALSLSLCHHHHHCLAATSFLLNVGNISALVRYQLCSFFCGTETACLNASLRFIFPNFLLLWPCVLIINLLGAVGVEIWFFFWI